MDDVLSSCCAGLDIHQKVYDPSDDGMLLELELVY